VERVGLQSDIVVDERMVRRLAWDAFRRLARGPLWLLMLFCVLFAVAAAIVLRDAAGPFVVTAALAVVVLPPAAYLTVRSHFPDPSAVARSPSASASRHSRSRQQGSVRRSRTRTSSTPGVAGSWSSCATGMVRAASCRSSSSPMTGSVSSDPGESPRRPRALS